MQGRQPRDGVELGDQRADGPGHPGPRGRTQPCGRKRMKLCAFHFLLMVCVAQSIQHASSQGQGRGWEGTRTNRSDLKDDGMGSQAGATHNRPSSTMSIQTRSLALERGRRLVPVLQEHREAGHSQPLTPNYLSPPPPAPHTPAEFQCHQRIHSPLRSLHRASPRLRC